MLLVFVGVSLRFNPVVFDCSRLISLFWSLVCQCCWFGLFYFLLLEVGGDF